MPVYFNTSGGVPTPFNLSMNESPSNSGLPKATQDFAGLMAPVASDEPRRALVETMAQKSLSAYYYKLGIDPSVATVQQQAEANAWLGRVEAERAEAAAGVTPQRASELRHLHDDHWWRSEYEHRPAPTPRLTADPWQAAPGTAYDEQSYWALRTLQLGFDPRNPPTSDFVPAADWSPDGNADAFGNPRP